MNTQTKPRTRLFARARTLLTQREVRRPVHALTASFVPDLEGDRGFGLGYGRSSSYGTTSSYVPGGSSLFRFC